MRQLDLFAGLGGFSLAASWFGIETTQFVEIEPFCQSLLAKNFPGVPIHADVSTFSPAKGQFDIITAGFPCQDASSCNPYGRGLEGSRTGLFFEAMRIIRTVRPRFAIFENVPNLINRGFERILWELAQSGFDAEWQVVSAASVGAPHLRERLFIIAYPEGQRSPGDCGNQAGANQASLLGDSWWRQEPCPEPSIPRMGHGVPHGMDRVKALGNAVVPQVAAIAYQRVMELNECQLL